MHVVLDVLGVHDPVRIDSVCCCRRCLGSLGSRLSSLFPRALLFCNCVLRGFFDQVVDQVVLGLFRMFCSYQILIVATNNVHAHRVGADVVLLNRLDTVV